MTIGLRWESCIRSWLEENGWQVESTGQGEWHTSTRHSLWHVCSPLRWFPEFIVSKNMTVCFVDAKASARASNNWSMETAAHESHEWLQRYARMPVIYMFDNFTWTTANFLRQAITDEIAWDGPTKSNGSGTPYKLFPKNICRTLDEFTLLFETKTKEPA